MHILLYPQVVPCPIFWGTTKLVSRVVVPACNPTYRAIVIKIAWYYYRGREVDQWNRVEGPEMNAQTYGHLILTKGAKTISGKKIAFSTNGAGSTGGQHVEECKLTPSYLLIQSSSPSGSRTSM
jgi:hypothetical protein